jgi:tungstate transport system substrate-binding protein
MIDRIPESSCSRPAHFLGLLAAVFAGALVFVCVSTNALHAEESPGSILLATTTSVRDSGLLDTLVPRFQARSGIHVRVVAVGTGAALRMGREGNADVLITHARASEEELVGALAALSRVPFMENHFVIAGPAEDPAGVAQAASPADAMRAIAGLPAAWVSRGDDSGTHMRERSLLKEAGLSEEGWEGFVRTGSGMGLTLQVAGERRAYVLSDIGTFLAYAERTQLAVLSKPDPSLRNVYAVLRISPERFPGRVNAEGAARFADFLLELETRELIAAFGVERYGRPLFVPLAPTGE